MPKKERRLKITPSMEDYLEAIHNLQEKKGAARSKDIAELLGVGRSSVTGALRNLSNQSLINYSPYDLVTLTEEGKKAAASVVRRHAVLGKFLHRVLSIPQIEAEKAACVLEHHLSEEAFMRLARLVDITTTCPRFNVLFDAQGKCPLDSKGKPLLCSVCLREEAKKAGKGVFGESLPLSSVSKTGTFRVSGFSKKGGASKKLRDSGLEVGMVVTVENLSEEGYSILVAGRHLRIPARDSQSLLVQPLLK